MKVEFNMFELDINYDKEKEINEKKELKDVSLKPLIFNKDVPMLDNIMYSRFFTMPVVPNMSYGQILLKCTSQLYSRLVNGLSKNQKVNSADDFKRFEKGEGETEDGIHIEMRHFLATLGGIVEYAINTSSYKSGEFYGFDAIELSHKVDTLKFYCNRLYKEDLLVSKDEPRKEPSFESISINILNRRAEPFYSGEKLGASIDIILEKIENKELDYHSRFFYLKRYDEFCFYTISDLK